MARRNVRAHVRPREVWRFIPLWLPFRFCSYERNRSSRIRDVKQPIRVIMVTTDKVGLSMSRETLGQITCRMLQLLAQYIVVQYCCLELQFILISL